MSGWAVFILILVLLPLGLLSVPLTFRARGCLRTEERWLEAGAAWGYGFFTGTFSLKGRETAFSLRLAGIPLPLSREKSEAVKARSKKVKKKDKKKTGRKEEKHRLNFSAAAVLNRDLLGAVLGYLQRLGQSFRIRLSGVYGTGDPALTGMLAGLIAAMNTGYHKINLEADFREPALELTGEISARIVPLVILWLTMRLLLAKPARTLWYPYLTIRLKRRKAKEGAQYV